MSEWPKEHAWKVCIPQGIEGSTPSLTAIHGRAPTGAFFVFVDACSGRVVNAQPQLAMRFHLQGQTVRGDGQVHQADVAGLAEQAHTVV